MFLQTFVQIPSLVNMFLGKLVLVNYLQEICQISGSYLVIVYTVSQFAGRMRPTASNVGRTGRYLQTAG